MTVAGPAASHAQSSAASSVRPHVCVDRGATVRLRIATGTDAATTLTPEGFCFLPPCRRIGGVIPSDENDSNDTGPPS